MKKIKSYICLALCFILMFGMTACTKEEETAAPPSEGQEQKIEYTDIDLYANGKTDYKILLSEESTPIEAQAAQELVYFFEMASAIKLEIISDGDYDASGKYISIGNTALFAASGIQLPEGLGTSGYIIKTVDDDVVIAASGNYGALYGTYEFLEYNLGYRYYAEDEIQIAKEPSVKLMKFDMSDKPSFESRAAYSSETRVNASSADRLRLNGNILANTGGSWWSSLNDQSLCLQLLPTDQYFEKYPRWYYDNGGDKVQICYTTLYNDSINYDKGDWSEEDYNSGKHGMFWTLVYNLINNYIIPESTKTVFQLGIMDTPLIANYPESIAEIEKYTASGVMMRAVNAVADAVADWQQENCPERTIYLCTFAYLSFFEPPCKKDENGEYIVDENTGKYIPIDESVVARDNVMVRYAPVDANYMYNLLDEEYNSISRKVLLGWASVAKNLAVWDYRADFGTYVTPYPSWFSTYDNLKIYYDYGFIDIFNQGPTPTTGTPFIKMDNWIRSQLMWDIDQSYADLVDEFMENYYKEGRDCIQEYWDLLQMHYRTYIEKEQNYDGDPHRRVMNPKYWPYEIILKIQEIFENGYASVAKFRDTDREYYDKLLSRLEAESLFYRFMLIQYYDNYYTVEERRTMIDEFERISNECGFVIMNNGIHNGEKVADRIAGWRNALL